jgi:hypothetical protein
VAAADGRVAQDDVTVLLTSDEEVPAFGQREDLVRRGTDEKDLTGCRTHARSQLRTHSNDE